MAKVKAVFIDSSNRTVFAGRVTGLQDMQNAVGGYIERALTLENGDEVYVNEEGLLSGPEYFFYIEGAHQPFAGNAVIIGKADKSGDSTDVKSSPVSIIKRTKFMNSLQVIASLHEQEE